MSLSVPTIRDGNPSRSRSTARPRACNQRFVFPWLETRRFELNPLSLALPVVLNRLHDVLQVVRVHGAPKNAKSWVSSSGL